MAGLVDGCSCDPSVHTIDCDTSACTPFISVFLVLQSILFLCYISTIIVVEINSKKKSLLWRIILGSCCFGCLAKVIRLGFLANENTRYSLGQVGLIFLYNTHLCFASVGFISLLFFWARLRHDLKSDTRIFGKLLPAYIVAIVITVVFYYAQVVVKALIVGVNISFYLMIVNGSVSFILAVIFLGYTVSVWRSFLRNTDPKSLFHKTYISAVFASIFIIAFCLEVLISNTLDSNTTREYLIKHALYETLFLCQLCAIPSGFIVHYYRHHISKTEKSDMSYNSSSAKATSFSSISHSSLSTLQSSQNSLSSLSQQDSEIPLTQISPSTSTISLTLSSTPPDSNVM